MNEAHKIGRFSWAAIAVLWLIVVIVPSLRAILRDDAMSVVKPPLELRETLWDLGLMDWPGEPRRPIGRSRMIDVANTHPNDYQIQLDAALDIGPFESRLPRLEQLIARFPNRASAYAQYLNNASDNNINIRRDYDEDMYSMGHSDQSAETRQTPSPQAFAVFDSYALAGERLDPQNAYFPMMRAVGLLAMYRDSDAIASIKRAGADSTWNDYLSDETMGRLRLHGLAFGQMNAIDRTTLSCLTLAAYQARIRAVSRIATGKAIQAAQAGNPAEEIAIRQAVMRTADLMRAHSSSGTGSMVGVAITANAAYRPGGEMRPANVPVEKWADQREKHYLSYVSKAGYPQVAPLAQIEFQTAQGARAILIKHPYITKLGPEYFRLILFRLAGMILLVNALWLCLLGAVARLRSTPALVVALLAATVALLWAAHGMHELAATGSAMWDIVKDLLTGQSGALPVGLLGLAAFLAILVIPAFSMLLMIGHEPLVDRMRRTFPVASVILTACLLGLLVLNAALDRTTNRALDASIIDEPHAIARSEGTTWPDAVSVPYYLAHVPK